VLNLSHDWLMRLLPFVLSKINRVSFGLLSAEQRRRALQVKERERERERTWWAHTPCLKPPICDNS
jgi:hypothetical protein